MCRSVGGPLCVSMSVSPRGAVGLRDGGFSPGAGPAFFEQKEILMNNTLRNRSFLCISHTLHVRTMPLRHMILKIRRRRLARTVVGAFVRGRVLPVHDGAPARGHGGGRRGYLKFDAYVFNILIC